MRCEIHLPVKNVVAQKTLDQMWNLSGMDDLEVLIDREGKYSIVAFFNDVFFQIVTTFAKTDVGVNLIKWFNQCIIVNNVNKVNLKCLNVSLKVVCAKGMRRVDREVLKQFVLVANEHLGHPTLRDWKQNCLTAFDDLIVKTPFLVEIRRLLKERIRAIVYNKYGCLHF